MTMGLVSVVNWILGVLVIAGQVLVVGYFIGLFSKKRVGRHFVEVFERYAFELAFLLVLGATLGSLFYSNIAGYEPCTLCWFQRVFLFPQVILLGIALLRHDHKIADYVLTLSVIGAVIAAYQSLLQVGAAPALPCSATTSQAVSCSQRFVFQFDYVTIPMMALTVFLLVGISMVSLKIAGAHNTHQ